MKKPSWIALGESNSAEKQQKATFGGKLSVKNHIVCFVKSRPAGELSG